MSIDVLLKQVKSLDSIFQMVLKVVIIPKLNGELKHKNIDKILKRYYT